MTLPALVLFDIAGTLIRDTGLTLDAYQVVLEDAGLPFDAAWLREHIGCRKESVFEELLLMHGHSIDSAADMAQRFALHIDTAIEAQPPVVQPGVEETFDWLRASSIRTGLITGFHASTAEWIRSAADWMPDVVVGSDEVANGRPAPDLVHEAMRRTGVEDVQLVAVVGDTPRDLELGHSAGCGWNIGVATGSYRLDELEPFPHTHLLESMLPLVDIFIAD